MRKRTRAVVTTMILALSGLVFVAPAAADDYFLSYDLAEGAFLTPGTILPVDSETLNEPAGAECLVTIESNNGLSVHPGNNLVLLHNGTPVATIFGIEDVPFDTGFAVGAFTATGNDELVLGIESTGAFITSSVGTAVIVCTGGPGTTTTTQPPGTTTTRPPGTTTTTMGPPGTTTTTMGPPGTTTSTIGPPGGSTSTTDPGGSTSTTSGDPGTPGPGTTPTAPGDHPETGSDLAAFLGLTALLGMVAYLLRLRVHRAGG